VRFVLKRTILKRLPDVNPLTGQNLSLKHNNMKAAAWGERKLLATQEEDIQSLVELGLTNSQSKVYLALIARGKTKGQTIWKNSGVARQDVYRVLAELHEKGLVEKVFAIPTEFKPISLKDGLAILLKNKAGEYANAEVKTKNLLQKFQPLNDDSSLGEYEFSLVPGKDATLLKFRTAFNEAQKSVDVIFYWKGFLDFVSTADIWRRKLKRDLKMRVIVYRSPGERATPSIVRNLRKKYLEIRYASMPPPATSTIFDRNAALITTSPTPNPLETPSLWLKNTGFVTIVQDYFDDLWCSLSDRQAA
jgi:sugar-specific transcriptional regulator TrmB